MALSPPVTAVRARPGRGLLVVLTALALALTGCSSPPPTLDFTATTLDGATLDAATLTGTPVVLWFWAPF